MKIEFSNKNLNKVVADCEVVFVVKKNLEHKFVTDKVALDALKFKGEDGETQYLLESKKLYVGVESLNHEDIRIGSAKAIRVAKKLEFKSLKVGLYIDNCEGRGVKGLVEGFILGNYSFSKYKSKPSLNTVEEIIICKDEYSDKKIDAKAIKEHIKVAEVIANSTNLTREIVNTAPFDMTPIKLAKKAEEVAKECGLSCQIFDEKYLQENNFGAFYAVSKGSDEPARLIHLSYKPTKKSLGKIAIVGKGLTYDSGGLSIKGSEHMVTMKADKSGGSAVIGIMSAIAKLNLPFEVEGVIGATENMSNGKAYKPDDVLLSRSGKTIEVRNTDAEGRLVLADCLDYAQDLKPNYIIDLATLTGACVVAVGEYSIGVMGNSKDLKHTILEASDGSGELCVELPANRYLRKLLKSEVADICNISSSRYGGAITASIFLDEFIREEYKDKWIHLDIAGPAYVEKEWGYNPFGASGAGVRLVIKWLQQLEKRSI